MAIKGKYSKDSIENEIILTNSHLKLTFKINSKVDIKCELTTEHVTNIYQEKREVDFKYALALLLLPGWTVEKGLSVFRFYPNIAPNSKLNKLRKNIKFVLSNKVPCDVCGKYCNGRKMDEIVFKYAPKGLIDETYKKKFNVCGMCFTKMLDIILKVDLG